MEVDVIVIGTGQAGVPLAARLAEAGRRVLIVERGPLGGTCVNTGCTPTKTMIASARAAHVARTAARLGVHADHVRVDLGAVVRRKEKLVHQWRSSIEKRLERAGERLTLLQGHARFTGPHQIEVAGERHRAPTIIVNTGAHPIQPPIDGLDGVEWLDNDGAMKLVEPPEHLLVIGGGYVGCELGQMFRRLGSDVTIIDRAPNLLAREDSDVCESIERVFTGEDISLRLGSGIERVRRDGRGIGIVLDNGEAVRGTHLLVAVGRRPNTENLGCDAAGIELDERGAIVIGDRFRTSAEGVYAVGDVAGGPQFTHASWDDHRVLFDILEGRDRSAAGRLVPYVVFTDPQIARAGLSEREAADHDIAHEVARLDFGVIARAIEVDERAGLIKILIDPESERILGATIVGIEAGELIHVIVAMMHAGATASTLVDAQIVHPTLAEGLQTALMKLPRFSLG